MAGVERFGVSMDSDLLEVFDRLISHQGYASMSEAIRDLVRRSLVEEEWTDPDAEVMAAVTLVYDHQVSRAIAGIQHSHHDEVVCTTHVHVDEENCMEVVVLRGRSSVVRHIALCLIANKGVKHGHLTCTTTGQRL